METRGGPPRCHDPIENVNVHGPDFSPQEPGIKHAVSFFDGQNSYRTRRMRSVTILRMDRVFCDSCLDLEGLQAPALIRATGLASSSPLPRRTPHERTRRQCGLQVHLQRWWRQRLRRFPRDLFEKEHPAQRGEQTPLVLPREQHLPTVLRQRISGPTTTSSLRRESDHRPLEVRAGDRSWERWGRGAEVNTSCQGRKGRAADHPASGV